MKRYILISCGWISVTLGVIGVVVPLLPTTPFLLVALACFSKSSEKFHSWLINHKLLGKYIAYWRENKKIPLNVIIKISLIAISTILVSLYSLNLLTFE